MYAHIIGGGGAVLGGAVVYSHIIRGAVVYSHIIRGGGGL